MRPRPSVNVSESVTCIGEDGMGAPTEPQKPYKVKELADRPTSLPIAFIR